MKKLEKKAIANQLEKYFLNHYSNLPNLERRGTEDYHILKFATPEKIVTLICDDFGKKKKTAKRRIFSIRIKSARNPFPKKKRKV